MGYWLYEGEVLQGLVWMVQLVGVVKWYDEFVVDDLVEAMEKCRGFDVNDSGTLK